MWATWQLDLQFMRVLIAVECQEGGKQGAGCAQEATPLDDSQDAAYTASVVNAMSQEMSRILQAGSAVCSLEMLRLCLSHAHIYLVLDAS